MAEEAKACRERDITDPKRKWDGWNGKGRGNVRCTHTVILIHLYIYVFIQKKIITQHFCKVRTVDNLRMLKIGLFSLLVFIGMLGIIKQLGTVNYLIPKVCWLKNFGYLYLILIVLYKQAVCAHLNLEF